MTNEDSSRKKQKIEITEDLDVYAYKKREHILGKSIDYPYKKDSIYDDLGKVEHIESINYPVCMYTAPKTSFGKKRNMYDDGQLDSSKRAKIS